MPSRVRVHILSAGPFFAQPRIDHDNEKASPIRRTSRRLQSARARRDADAGAGLRRSTHHTSTVRRRSVCSPIAPNRSRHCLALRADRSARPRLTPRHVEPRSDLLARRVHDDASRDLVSRSLTATERRAGRENLHGLWGHSGSRRRRSRRRGNGRNRPRARRRQDQLRGRAHRRTSTQPASRGAFTRFARCVDGCEGGGFRPHRRASSRAASEVAASDVERIPRLSASVCRRWDDGQEALEVGVPLRRRLRVRDVASTW
jgi:hypothetical protein